MPNITTPLLVALNSGVQTAFNSQLSRAESPHRLFTYPAASTGREEVYPRLDLMRGVREWLGDRIVQQLGTSLFTIKNRKFEQTIGISGDDIRDDRMGMFTPVAAEMGEAARIFPARLVAELMLSGTTAVGYDGQYFFDTDHPGWNSSGAAVTNVSNYTSGSDPGWYLIDNSRVLKPFILQTREDFSLTARFNPEDPSVFDKDEFLWGTRGRMAAGFGIWQLAYYSKAAFTQANIIAARTAMAGIRRPDGTPMGIMPDTLVVPTTLAIKAKSFFENSQVANDAGSALVENTIRGLFRPIEFPWLN